MDNLHFSAFSKVVELNGINDHKKCTLPLSVVISLTSNSQGKPVARVNASLERFFSELQASESLFSELELSILTSQEYVTVLRPLSSINKGILIPIFSAKGEQRALAQALEVSINMLRTKVAQAKKVGESCRRPWLLVITDGQGTDVWEDTSARLKHWSKDKSIIPVIINIGSEVESLNEYSIVPPFQGVGKKLDTILKWVTDCIVKVSRADQGTVVSLPNPPKMSS